MRQYTVGKIGAVRILMETPDGTVPPYVILNAPPGRATLTVALDESFPDPGEDAELREALNWVRARQDELRAMFQSKRPFFLQK